MANPSESTLAKWRLVAQAMIYGDEDGNWLTDTDAYLVAFPDAQSNSAAARAYALKRHAVFQEILKEEIDFYREQVVSHVLTTRRGQIQELIKDYERTSELIKARKDAPAIAPGSETGIVAVKDVQTKDGGYTEAKFDAAVYEQRQAILKRILELTGQDPAKKFDVTSNGESLSKLSNEEVLILRELKAKLDGAP